jgi:hypothetical protein
MKWNMATFSQEHTILVTGDFHLTSHPNALPQRVKEETLMEFLVRDLKVPCD